MNLKTKKEIAENEFVTRKAELKILVNRLKVTKDEEERVDIITKILEKQDEIINAYFSNREYD